MLKDYKGALQTDGYAVYSIIDYYPNFMLLYFSKNKYF